MTGDRLTLTRITPLSKELLGDWDGAIEAGGARMHLTIKLQNGPDGLATGMLISVDQNNSQAPIRAVLVRGTRVTFIMPAVRGAFDGQFKDGQLTGTWTQPGGAVPLVLKRKS